MLIKNGILNLNISRKYVEGVLYVSQNCPFIRPKEGPAFQAIEFFITENMNVKKFPSIILKIKWGQDIDIKNIMVKNDNKK